MENSTEFWKASDGDALVQEDDMVTAILKMIVAQLSWSSTNHSPEPLNLTSVMSMLDQMTELQRQVLYNATETTSEQELIHFLNVTIMRSRQLESLIEFQEIRVQKILLFYVPPILILLGTFGNLFSFIVLRRKPMLKVSSYLYLAVLAIIDTMVLYNGLLRIWIVELMDFDYQDTGNWVCKLTVAFGYVSSDLSVWLIIAVTVERYIVVCFPFQASSMCNVSRARKVIVGLLLLMLSLNVHFMWTTEIVQEQGRNVCRGGEHFQQLVEVIWPWVDTLIYSLLPFVTITILNVLIIREVAGAHSSRMGLNASESEGANISTTNSTRHRRGTACEGTRLTALLLTVSFTFLLLTLPNNIALIVSRFWNQKYEKTADQLSQEEKREVVHDMAQFKLIMTITELLMYTNHSINFFLYCATGNKFRQQIFDLFRCLQRHSRTHTQADNTWASHSMRKTSQSVLALESSEMIMGKRATRRKSSCISSEEVTKKVDNELFLGRNRDTFVNIHSNTATKEYRYTAGVDKLQSVSKFIPCERQEFLNEKENYEKDSYEKRLKSCNGTTNNNSQSVQYTFCPHFELDCNDRRQMRTIYKGITSKVHESKKWHRHFSNSKKDGYFSRYRLNSNEKEYFLLTPTVRLSDSAGKC